MKNNAGFTLIELMITVAIVGILLVVGVPSLKNTMQSNQVIAASNDLVSAMHIARSEAIKLNSRVTICESSNGTSCGTTGSWEDGWIVFVDADGLLDNIGTACEAAGTDCLLRVRGGFDDDQLIVRGLDDLPPNAVVNSITFTSRGLPKSDTGVPESGIFRICSYDNSNNIVHSRAVVLSISGRVRISDDPNLLTGVFSCPPSP